MIVLFDLIKAHVKGFTRKDGVFVKPHETKVNAAPKEAPGMRAGPALQKKVVFGSKPGAGAAKVTETKVTPAPDKSPQQGGLWGKPAPYTKKPPFGSVPHPRVDDHGEDVHIKRPHKPTDEAAWKDPAAAVTVLPDGAVPVSLNGVRFSPWKDAPTTEEGWDYVDGVNDDLDEPPFHPKAGKHAAAGVVIEEPDGRIWLVAPTNAFGGYHATFPKGTAEDGLSLQANAIKEAFEESGLRVRITGFVGDFERTTSVARMYRAERVGGTPAAMGWESQAVHLVPKDQMYSFLNMDPDHGPAEAAGAGTPPPPKSKYKGPPVMKKPSSPTDDDDDFFPDESDLFP